MSRSNSQQKTTIPLSDVFDAAQANGSDGEKGEALAYLAHSPAAEGEALSQTMQTFAKPPRRAWLDYLRVFAILAVITGHVIVDFYDRFGEVGAAEWWVSNVLGVLARSAVPLFVMVSGALLLGRTYKLGEFYKKRMLRFLPPLFFWNLVYLGVYILDGMDRQTVFWTLKALFIVDGYIAPHLWYLSMFVCLMLFAPFVNKFILGEKPTPGELALLLGLAFPFFALQQVANVAEGIYGLRMEWFTLFPWFVVYFIAGYFIDRYGAVRLGSGWIAAAIAALVAVCAGLNYYAVSVLGIMKNYFINTDRGALQFLLSALIFLLAKNLSARLAASKLVLALAEASFGMYLIHEIFNGMFAKILPGYLSLGLVSIFLVPALTTVLSFTSIHLLRKIRWMRLVC